MDIASDAWLEKVYGDFVDQSRAGGFMGVLIGNEFYPAPEMVPERHFQAEKTR